MANEQVIRAKARRPSALGYNSWMALDFGNIAVGANQAASAIQSRIPLGLNMKIVAVSLVPDSAAAGTLSFNIASGAGLYETPATEATPASATITFTGTFNGGAIFNFFVNGNNISGNQIYSYSVGSGPYNGDQMAAAVFASAPPGPSYGVVMSLSGNVITVTSTTPGTAGNSVVISDATSGGAGGTYTLSGATLSGGTNSGPAVPPVLPPTDSTYSGIVPSVTATAGDALFATDQVVTMTPEMVQTFFPTVFDAIWPSGSELTLRFVSNGSAAGHVKVIAYTTPYDLYSYRTQNTSTLFIPSASTI
jgi:hypothetical protein